jgi:hypothetical protein
MEVPLSYGAIRPVRAVESAVVEQAAGKINVAAPAPGGVIHLTPLPCPELSKPSRVT